MRKVQKAICTKSGKCGNIQFEVGDELVVCGGGNGFHLMTEEGGFPVDVLCHTFGDCHIPVECKDEYYEPHADYNLPEFKFEDDMIAENASHRSLIDKKEPRSRRVQLLMKPSIYFKIKKIAKETEHSFNHIIECALDYALCGFVDELKKNKEMER